MTNTTSTSEAAAFLSPVRLWERAEILSSPCPVPAAAGVYGWWFRQLPAPMDVSQCRVFEGQVLLYTGISPRRPPANGQPSSMQSLRSRIGTHLRGNAEGSTLRKTLGCLLADQLGIELRRVGSGKRMTFVEGEQTLSAWMALHARVAWIERPRPWELEDYLIGTVDLPLNLQGNSHNPFHPQLTVARAAAVGRAKSLPVLPNPGVGG